MRKVRLSFDKFSYILPALILALVAGYYISEQLIINEPEIFFIESESDETYRRFVIANPPKNGNKLVELILAHEKTLNLPSDKYYRLIYFKETRRSPRNFDSRKDIPTKCHFYEVEPSCMDNGDIIANIDNDFVISDRNRVYTAIPFFNNKGLICNGLVFYKDGSVWESGCKK